MMGFGLLVGHLVGDYILQNDWMAKSKSNTHPGIEPANGGYRTDEDLAREKEWHEWYGRSKGYKRGLVACTLHCLLYAFAVWACSYWWMPYWMPVAVFLIHWPIDRYRLAKWWMTKVSGQTEFATGPLSPWSVIVVDNVAHLLTLWGLTMLWLQFGRLR